MTWIRGLSVSALCLVASLSAAAQTISGVPAIPAPVLPSDQLFIFRGLAPAYSTTVSTLLSGLTTGVFGPGSSTNGHVPTWNGVSGNLLGAGLPVGTTGISTIVETDASGLISTTLLPTTGSGSVVLATSPTMTSPRIAGSSSGSTILQASAIAGGTLTFPAITGTLITTADIGTVPNAALANSSITINGSTCTLGASCTIPVVATKPFGKVSGPPATYACFDTQGHLFSFPFHCR